MVVVQALRASGKKAAPQATDDPAALAASDSGSGQNYVALLEQFHNADTDNDGKLYKDVRCDVNRCFRRKVVEPV